MGEVGIEVRVAEVEGAEDMADLRESREDSRDVGEGGEGGVYDQMGLPSSEASSVKRVFSIKVFQRLVCENKGKRMRVISISFLIRIFDLVY